MTDISIGNIYKFLSSEGKSLNDEEEYFLNTVFEISDLEDREGNFLGLHKGDGRLNLKEWSDFIQNLISRKHLKTLYQKLTNFINKTNENIQYDYFAKNKIMNPGMYNEEMLKKHFPEDKYKIQSSKEQGLTSVEVRDKSTGETILKYENHNGENQNFTSITVNNVRLTYSGVRLSKEEDLTDGTKTNYRYSSGHVYTNITRGNSVDISYVDDKLVYKYADNQEYELYGDGSYRTFDAKIGDEIYYDSNGNITDQKNSFWEKFDWIAEHQDTKEDLINLLNDNINKKNALQILSNTKMYNVIHNMLYKLCKDSEEDKKSVLAELFQKCVAQAEGLGFYTEDLKSKPSRYNTAKLMARCNSKKGDLKDEPITKDTKIEQGVTGNCWLLVKIASLARTVDGLNILNSMYLPVRNPDKSIKSVIVTVQGNKYDIPAEEIDRSNELSSGNLFVRAIEIGVFKYLESLGQERTYELESSIFTAEGERPGGSPSLGSEILVGDGIELEEFGSYTKYVDKTRSIDDNFMQELKNTQNALIGVGTTAEGYKAYVVESGKFENISPDHAYSVVEKDDEFLYLIEPSNNKKTLRMTYEEFKNCFEYGDITPIKNRKKMKK